MAEESITAISHLCLLIRILLDDTPGKSYYPLLSLSSRMAFIEVQTSQVTKSVVGGGVWL